RAEVDLARILDGEHVAARHSPRGLLAPALDQPLDRHILVGQEAAIAYLPRAAAAAELAQANTLLHGHTLEQLRPFLSRRRSPNRPSEKLVTCMATPRGDSKCQ